MLLSLKNSTEESDWQTALTCIVRSLILKPYGVLDESIEPEFKNSNEDDIKLPNWDAPEYTFFAEFHVLASKYLSSGIYLMAFVPQKVQLSPQNTFSIVTKVFGILVKLHRENKINIADELDTELAHELILHSLHSQKRIHTNLCGAYKALCGGIIA